MFQSTVQRKMRLEDFVEVVDVDGRQQLLPTSTCEAEEHHSHVVLRFDPPGQHSVCLSHRDFNALVGVRKIVYLSW